MIKSHELYSSILVHVRIIKRNDVWVLLSFLLLFKYIKMRCYLCQPVWVNCSDVSHVFFCCKHYCVDNKIVVVETDSKVRYLHEIQPILEDV